jgi:hypothetical protein
VACGCTRRTTTQYRWTDGENVIIYDSLMAAKAKVMRRGGSYEPIEKDKN